jgi:hypothetical protein
VSYALSYRVALLDAELQKGVQSALRPHFRRNANSLKQAKVGSPGEIKGKLANRHTNTEVARVRFSDTIR